MVWKGAKAGKEQAVRDEFAKGEYESRWGHGLPSGGEITGNIDSVENQDDFDIINGVLKKYVGVGGDVVIPNSVTSLGKFAFL